MGWPEHAGQDSEKYIETRRERKEEEKEEERAFSLEEKEARQEMKELQADREEEDARNMDLELANEEDKIHRGRYKPRLGPRMDQLSKTQLSRVKEARSKAGTTTECGCYEGRGIIPAGHTREFMDESRRSCCERFEPLDEKWKVQGRENDHILNAKNICEDIENQPGYWDRSIGEIMQAGVSMFYTGNDRNKVKTFKNPACESEAQEATRKAWLKDLKGLPNVRGDRQPFIESLGMNPEEEATRRGWKGYTVNSLGSCPKSDGSYRVYDNAKSINDDTHQISMPKIYMSNHEGFENLVRDLKEKNPGKRILACKRDASSYFRCFRVCDEDLPLTLIRYTLEEEIRAGEGGDGVAGAKKGETFLRRGASYGNRAWPMYACRLTNALMYTMAKLDGIEGTCGFIDDVVCAIVVDEEDDAVPSAKEVGEKMDARFDRWGIPRNAKKQKLEGNWDPTVVWLGVNYDLSAFVKWIAKHRVEKALGKIDEILGDRFVNQKGVPTLPAGRAAKILSEVVGCLVSISSVIEIGRTWTASLRRHLRLANKHDRGIRLDDSAVVELNWWRNVLRGGQGNKWFVRSFLKRPPAKVAFYTDASGWGFGAYYPGGNRKGGGKNLYMSHQWNKQEREALGDLTRKSRPNERWRATMETAEAFALLAFVEAMKKELAGGNHIIYVDNEPVKYAMRAGRAKVNDHCGLIVRRLWEIRAQYDFGLEIRRVSTKLNREADAMSREHGLRSVLLWLNRADAGPVKQVQVNQELRNFFVGCGERCQKPSASGDGLGRKRKRTEERGADFSWFSWGERVRTRTGSTK